MMFASKQDTTLPRDITADLLISHERRPYPDTRQDIEELAASIKDPNYRIKVAQEGIFMFNRDGLMQDSDPFAFYPQLDLKDDTGHAFYLGAELARAQIAWQLGKRYNQDEELKWGCAVDVPEEDLTEQTEEGTTLTTGKKCGTA